MLFNSFQFLLLFLPLTLIGFYGLGARWGSRPAIAWLIVTSLIFYASWEARYLPLLIASMALNFAVARVLDRSGSHCSGLFAEQKARKTLLILAITANVLVLAYYKALISVFAASDAGADSGHGVFTITHDVLIPLAISFITFQQIAFLVDTFKGRTRGAHPLEYVAFICFFPQLVMGPIVHYRELVPQFRSAGLVRLDWNNIAIGLAIFILGLSQKVIVADSLAPYVNNVYASLANGGALAVADAWGASIAFQIQIYFDFSGYALMAIGLGRMFNIRLPINFDSPLRAQDRFDFWRRWHISLGAFMRQYVFFPLARAKRLRLGNTGALVATTVISALWHGFGLTFLIWGVAQGAVMLGRHYLNQFKDRHGKGRAHRKRRARQTPWLAILLTVVFTMLLGVLFRSSSLEVAGQMYSAILRPFIELFAPSASLGLVEAGGAPIDDPRVRINNIDLFWIAVGALIIWGLPNTRVLFGKHWNALDQRSNPPKYTAPDLIPGTGRLRFALTRAWAAAIALLLVACLAFMDGSSRFIYYQF